MDSQRLWFLFLFFLKEQQNIRFNQKYIYFFLLYSGYVSGMEGKLSGAALFGVQLTGYV